MSGRLLRRPQLKIVLEWMLILSCVTIASGAFLTFFSGCGGGGRGGPPPGTPTSDEPPPSASNFDDGAVVYDDLSQRLKTTLPQLIGGQHVGNITSTGGSGDGGGGLGSGSGDSNSGSTGGTHELKFHTGPTPPTAPDSSAKTGGGAATAAFSNLRGPGSLFGSKTAGTGTGKTPTNTATAEKKSGLFGSFFGLGTAPPSPGNPSDRSFSDADVKPDAASGKSTTSGIYAGSNAPEMVSANAGGSKSGYSNPYHQDDSPVVAGSGGSGIANSFGIGAGSAAGGGDAATSGDQGVNSGANSNYNSATGGGANISGDVPDFEAYLTAVGKNSLFDRVNRKYANWSIERQADLLEQTIKKGQGE